MELIKITTNEQSMVKKYMNELMSFDKGVGEIIVGWELAKSMGANILEHKINEKTYWTFSPREKRKIFEQHMTTIPKDILQGIVDKIIINNINPLDYNSDVDLINYIDGSLRGCDGYLFKDRLYIYCGNKIHHLDVGLLKFLSWDIFNQVKEIINLKEYQSNTKLLDYFDIKYIPYFDAEENIIISNIRN